MSYLILPLLVEGGLFGPACRHHRTICAFHASAKRDTLDMVGRCYLHANYNKAAELHRFIQLCQASVQLALSRIELPLLELTDSRHNQEDARAYLNDYFANKYVESQSYLDDAVGPTAHGALDLLVELSHGSGSVTVGLSDNLDYELLVSAESTVGQVKAARHTRQAQLAHRIRMGQEALRVLYCALCGEMVAAGSAPSSSGGSDNGGVFKAWEHLHKLRALLLPSASTASTTSDSQSSSATTAATATANKGVYSFEWLTSSTPLSGNDSDSGSACASASEGYLQWDQRLVGGGVPGMNTTTATDPTTSPPTLSSHFTNAGHSHSQYDTLLNTATLAVMQFALSHLSSGSDTTHPTVSAGDCLSALSAVKEWLSRSSTIRPCTLLSARWIRAVSALARTLATWGALLLVKAATRVGAGTGAGASAGAGAGGTESVRSVVAGLQDLLEGVIAVMDVHTNTTTAATDATVESASDRIFAWLQSADTTADKPAGTAGGDRTDPPVVGPFDGLRAVAEQLASSRVLSCNSLKSILSSKLTCLQELQ